MNKGLIAFCYTDPINVANILDFIETNHKVPYYFLDKVVELRTTPHIVVVHTLESIFNYQDKLKSVPALTILLESPSAAKCVRAGVIDSMESKLGGNTSGRIMEFSKYVKQVLVALSKGKPHPRVTMPDIPIKFLDSLPPSQVQAIASYLYTVQSVPKRYQLSRTIYSWLISGDSLDDLRTLLRKSESTRKLLESLDSPHTDNLRHALIELGVDSKEADETQLLRISKKYQVSTFDLHFALKQLRSYPKIGEDDSNDDVPDTLLGETQNA